MPLTQQYSRRIVFPCCLIVQLNLLSVVISRKLSTVFHTVGKLPSSNVTIKRQLLFLQMLKKVWLGYRPSAVMQIGNWGKSFLSFCANRRKAFCSQSCFSKSPSGFSIHSVPNEIENPLEQTNFASNTLWNHVVLPFLEVFVRHLSQCFSEKLTIPLPSTATRKYFPWKRNLWSVFFTNKVWIIVVLRCSNSFSSKRRITASTVSIWGRRILNILE